MAELVDALGSGPSWGNPVEVRVLFRALAQSQLDGEGAHELRLVTVMKGCLAHVLKLADRLV
jgi:hypothetical protein